MTKEMNLFGTTQVKYVDCSRDEAFKRVFCRKDVLAGILIDLVPEYKGLTHSDVMNRIISSDCKNINADSFTEDVGFPKKVIYDIVIKCSDSTNVELFFDLEMQRKYNVGYSVASRGIYYGSRLLSGQLESGEDYSKLVPVYSAWICTHGVPKELENKVLSFRTQCTNEGEVDNSTVRNLEESAQLVNLDLILLSENYDFDKDDRLMNFIQSIFKGRIQDRTVNPWVEPSMDFVEGVSILMSKEDEYKMELEAEKAEGRAEGREEGRAEGRESTIAEAIRNLRKGPKHDRVFAKETIRTLFGLKPSEAEELLRKYYD